jgi:hypothetical protein
MIKIPLGRTGSSIVTDKVVGEPPFVAMKAVEAKGKESKMG